MNDELIAFAKLYFTDELVRELNRSFDLMNKFDMKFYHAPYNDILMQHQNIHNDDLTSMFIAKVNADLDFILEQHSIKLISDASITDKNDILSVFALVMELEDYTPVMIALESLENDEEILANIIAEYSSLTPTKVVSLIEYFNPNILALLKQYASTREEEKAMEPFEDIYKTLQVYSKVFGADNIASHLVADGLIVGQPFSTYINLLYVDMVEGTNKYIAINILSLLLISSDGKQSPLEVFKLYSLYLLHDLNKVKAIESEIMANYVTFKEHLEHAK